MIVNAALRHIHRLRETGHSKFKCVTADLTVSLAIAQLNSMLADLDQENRRAR